MAKDRKTIALSLNSYNYLRKLSAEYGISVSNLADLIIKNMRDRNMRLNIGITGGTILPGSGGGGGLDDDII